MPGKHLQQHSFWYWDLRRFAVDVMPQRGHWQLRQSDFGLSDPWFALRGIAGCLDVQAECSSSKHPLATSLLILEVAKEFTEQFEWLLVMPQILWYQ